MSILLQKKWRNSRLWAFADASASAAFLVLPASAQLVVAEYFQVRVLTSGEPDPRYYPTAADVAWVCNNLDEARSAIVRFEVEQLGE